MRTFFVILALAMALAVPISQYNVPNFSTPGLGWAFSGAGGRIAQQSAMAQALLNGNYPNGTRLTPAVLSGTSSGSLSAIGLNGLLEYRASNGARGWSQDSWNNFVFNLKNSDVYRTGIRGILGSAKGLTDGYLLDNTPLTSTLNNALRQLNYTVLGDLFLPTYISTVDQRTGQVVRFLSTDANVSSIPLIQILLATTAIPVAFPPRQIPALTNNTLFVDGGVSIDYLPVVPLLNGPITATTIYGFTPNKDPSNNNNSADDDNDVESNGIIRNILRAFEIQGNQLLTGDLSILANSEAKAYLYQPVLGQSFSTLNFNNERQQYDLTAAWARNNNPTEISADNTAFTFDSTMPAYYRNQSDTYNSAFSQGGVNGGSSSMFALTGAVVLVAVMALL